MLEIKGLCMGAAGAGIFVPPSAVEVRRIVAESAHMKVVVRTFGRDARVKDWLTRFFQIITCPSVYG